MSRGFASNYRIVLLATGLLACFAGLGARLVCLHVLDRDELLRNIVKTRRQTVRETARRGDIIDASGAILATSRPMVRVAIDPFFMRDEDEPKLPQLAALVGLPVEKLRTICATKYRPVATLKITGPGSAKPAVASESGPAAAAPGGTMLKLNLPLPVSGADKPDGDGDEEFGRELAAVNDAAPKTADAAATPKDDDDEELGNAVEPQGRPIRWVKLADVSEATYARIEALRFRALCAPERRFARVYPHNELAAHIVGFANSEGKGAAGVERFADLYLRGQDGWREGEKDGRRRELAQFQTRDIPRSDGYSVRLSIDQTVQDIVEREIEKIADKYKPLKATIIVSQPGTGFILGMANYPTFNLNEFGAVAKSAPARTRNVAVTDIYEPGSVFKIVAASAALEEGLVNVDTAFNCSTDHITYRNRDLRLPAEDHHFDHPLTVAEIIAHSSNRGAAQLAMLVGEDKFEKYARAFGFGSRLGFPLDREEPGLLRPHQKWYPIDFTRIPMGQSIAATALQMHMAMSTVANGGVLLRPQVIREIRDTSNTVVFRYGRTEIDRVISERTARVMAKLLQGVASRGGTAPGAAIVINGVDYEVAGKTGTAQKYLPEVLPSGKTKLMPSKKHHVVSFVGFFPASRPQVAISVVVDDADAHAENGVAYGAAVAAPVFKSIGQKLIPILSITPPNQPARVELAAATQGGRR